MINFVSKKTEISQRWVKVQRGVKGATTVVLALYVVGAAAWLGWWAYLSTRGQKASAEVERLTREVVQYAPEEVMVRKLEARTRIVETALSERVEAGDYGEVLGELELPVLGWEFVGAGSKQQVTVAADEAGGIRDYIASLAENFGKVRQETVSWDAETGWSGTVSFSDLLKEK